MKKFIVLFTALILSNSWIAFAQSTTRDVQESPDVFENSAQPFAQNEEARVPGEIPKKIKEKIFSSHDDYSTDVDEEKGDLTPNVVKSLSEELDLPEEEKIEESPAEQFRSDLEQGSKEALQDLHTQDLNLKASEAREQLETRHESDTSIKKRKVVVDPLLNESYRAGLAFGFNEEQFYLSPRERIDALRTLDSTKLGVKIFMDKMTTIDPMCLFPGDGYYTILVPKDEYFAEVVVQADTEVEICRLLKHYIIAEPLLLESIEEVADYTSLAGDQLVIMKQGKDFYIGEVKISAPLVFAEDGLIVHLIDGTLPLNIPLVSH